MCLSKMFGVCFLNVVTSQFVILNFFFSETTKTTANMARVRVLFQNELHSWDLPLDGDHSFERLRNELELRCEEIEERLETEKWDVFAMTGNNECCKITNNNDLINAISKNQNLNLKLLFENDRLSQHIQNNSNPQKGESLQKRCCVKRKPKKQKTKNSNKSENNMAT